MSRSDALARFEQSMVIGYEEWHDGIGYDLDALNGANPAERVAIEELLVAYGVRGWRDVEALAALGTPRARALLESALPAGSHEVRMAVLRYAPGIPSPAARVAFLVDALEHARFYEGLRQALEEVATFHPEPLKRALFRGVLERDGGVAVHFAAMLTFLYGRAEEPFDMEQRPFFLRFNTEDAREREAVFRELCTHIGVDPVDYVGED